MVVAAGVLVVLVGVPVLQRGVAGRATRRLAPARAELTAQTVELLHGLPELLAFGAADRQLAAMERQRPAAPPRRRPGPPAPRD